MGKPTLKWLILVGGGLGGWECIYQILQFPSLSMGCTFIVSAFFLSKIEQSRFRAQHAYFMRKGYSSASLWRKLYLLIVVFLKAMGLSVLSYFLSCQCRTTPLISMQFPSFCLGLLFLIHYLEQRPWGHKFYVFPLFYSYFALLIGLINTLLLYPSNQEGHSFILSKRIYLTFAHFVRFGQTLYQGNTCKAYTKFNQSFEQFFSFFPSPFNHILDFLLALEMAHGFLMIIYTWALYTGIRWIWERLQLTHQDRTDFF
jgi:hypothetical protein